MIMVSALQLIAWVRICKYERIMVNFTLVNISVDAKDTNLFREREQREGEIGALDTVHGALVHQGALPLGCEQLPLLRMEGDVGVETAGYLTAGLL